MIKKAKFRFALTLGLSLLAIFLVFGVLLDARLSEELEYESEKTISPWAHTLIKLEKIVGPEEFEPLLSEIGKEEGVSIKVSSERPDKNTPGTYTFEHQNKYLSISLPEDFLEKGAFRTEFVLNGALFLLLLLIFFLVLWLEKQFPDATWKRVLRNIAARNPLTRLLPLKPGSISEKHLQYVRELEQNTANALDAFPIGFFLTDSQGQIVYANETFYTQELGLEEKDILYDGWLNYVHPEDVERVNQEWKNCIEQSNPIKVHFRFRSPTGGEFWEKQVATPIRNTHQDVIGYVGALISQTKGKTFERAAEKQKERLDLALETAHLGTWSWDIKRNIRTFERSWFQSFALPHTEENLDPLPLIHPDDRARYEAHLDEIRNGKKDKFNIEFRFETGENEWRWVREEAQITERDRFNHPLIVVGLHSDIHEQVTFIQNLTSLAEIVEFSQDGIVRVNVQENVVFSNKRAEEILESRDVKGVLILEGVKNALSHAKEERRSRSVETSFEGEKEKRLLLNISPLIDNKGSFNGFAIVIRDITASLELAKKQELFALQQLEFISLLSHRLRTPISTMEQSAEALAMQKKDFPEELYKLVLLLEKNAHQIARMLHSILDYQVESVEKTNFPLNELLEECFSLIKNSAEEKLLQLNIDLYMPSPTIYGDKTRLALVLTNLLENAVEFTKEGSITLSSQLEGNEVAISVADTGEGCPPDLTEKIFDPFFQARDVFIEYGSGLGLSIAKKIVTEHGGRITCASEVGKGSVFTFYLKVVKKG